MNNLSVYKDIFEQYGADILNNTKVVVALIIFIGLNLLVTCVNVWAQFSVKNKDKKILTFSLKEKRRIEICESIFHDITELSDILGPHNEVAMSIINKVNFIRSNVTRNKLYISNSLYDHINNILDYYITIASDPLNKDIGKEDLLFKEYSKIFNI